MKKVFITTLFCLLLQVGCSQNTALDESIIDESFNSSSVSTSIQNSSDLYEDDMGFIRFSEGKYYGIKDESGEVIIPAVYSMIFPFDEHGYAKTMLWSANETLLGEVWSNDPNQKFGYVNREGDVILEPIYDFISDVMDQTLIASLDGKYGTFDTNFETVIPFEYEYLGMSSGDLLLARKEGKEGFITLLGESQIPLQFEHVLEFSAETGENENNYAIVFPIYKELYSEPAYNQYQSEIKYILFKYAIINSQGEEVYSSPDTFLVEYDTQANNYEDALMNSILPVTKEGTPREQFDMSGYYLQIYHNFEPHVMTPTIEEIYEVVLWDDDNFDLLELRSLLEEV